MQAVLITRGSRGMALFQPKQPTMHVPIFGSDEVADVTGAGDTVIATFGLALAAGASFYEAARLANYAGGLVVMKRGTATVSARELSDAVTSDHDTSLENWSQEGPPQGRRSDVENLRIRSSGLRGRVRSRSSSKRSRAIARRGAPSRSPTAASICCTSATCATCRRAAAEADRLIVAVNDDRSVAGLKGAGRPILPAADRAELVAALRGVDYVVVFGDPNVERLLRLLKPDVHCKGTDYTVDTVPERAVVAGLRRPHGDRRRSEAARDARAARAHRRTDQRPATDATR